MGLFERYLTLWVLLAIGLGILLGSVFPQLAVEVEALTYSQINLPIGILVFAMIYPMMLRIDFSSIGNAKLYQKGLVLTLLANWVIKPFSMAAFAWLFFRVVFADWLSPATQDEYLAGAILLGAAPCTAMVFVWSYLTKGNANYTLIQVSVNDIVLMVAFVPLVQFLLGIADLVVPYDVLLLSVLAYVVAPLLLGYITYRWVHAAKGAQYYNKQFLPAFKPVAILSLLLTVVLLFSIQGDALIAQPVHILHIAVPLTIQTYFIFFITWWLGRKAKLPHPICGPSALIGASNFFELAVAVAISLYGVQSGAALATVVGVLIEVPVMLSLVRLVNKWKY